MFANVVSPVTVPPPVPTVGAAARAEQGAQPLAGEIAASAARPEISYRVDPPKAMAGSVSLRNEERRPPPDPDGPAGPPPTFDATPLQRERERAMASMNLIASTRAAAPKAEERPEASEDVRADATAPRSDAAGSRGEATRTARAEPGEPAVRTTEAKPRPDPDAEAIERLETEVAEVRRMADPEPERSLDVVR